ncbi:hypothetical protein CBS101457_004824 [Exobasidium rhododendri]|nr:hypothetical protein CBS101457_004824 [Exobasidium rhododendri]
MSRRSDDSDIIEREALILHRLDTDPAKRAARSSSEAHRYSHEIDDEEMGMPIRPPSPVLDKTGRPEWLEEGINATKHSKRLRIFFIAGTVLLLVGVFAFAFSSGSEDGRVHKVYHWAGDYWKGGDKDAAVGAPYLFPTDVGYPGAMQTGKPADLADEDHSSATPTRGSSPINTVVPELDGFDPFQHMGPLTPYRSAPDFSVSSAKYRSLPSTCRVDRVHILHRHGSRYPTSGSPAFLVKQLLAKGRDSLSFSGPLSFLTHYDADRLGAELLVGLGREQLFRSGVLHSMEYGNLIEGDLQAHKRLLIRTGSQQRIVDSSIAFLQGIFGAKWHHQTDLEVQIEAPTFNTTLAPNFACPAANVGPGYKWSQDWIQDYLKKAVDRLQEHVKGAQLTPALLNGMQQLCSYDTVAFGRSDFCRLFTQDEWLGYEYAWDLVFYGSYGDGTPVGKAQGVGWVNEFMSRLTKTVWNLTTQTTENSTLNQNPKTFPVDRRFYADFTHDSTIAGVLAALNLPDFAVPLPVHAPDPKRKYITSNLVPFAARLIFEEISCNNKSSVTETSFVRMLLNEAVIDLHQLKGCSARDDGMCNRREFITAMEGRNKWSEWSNCTASTTMQAL